MRRHAKATSAGSTSGGGASLGSISRGALATRASSFGSDGSGALSHRRARFALALVLALTGLFALTATPAFAVSQVFSTTIGSSGAGAGQLNFASTAGGDGGRHAGDVAVDQSTGDIYVADAGNRRVDKFDSAGNFILAFGRDVDQTSGGDVCTAASGDTCQAGTPGTGGGAFVLPEYVAVDNSGGPSDGDVYVGDTGMPFGSNTDVVSKFTPGGVHLNADIDGSTTPRGVFGADAYGIFGMTVDPDGNLWVYAAGYLAEFDPSGLYLQNWLDQYAGSSNPRGIAADRSHVYVVMGDQRLARYSHNGLVEGFIQRRTPGFISDDPTRAQRVTVDPDTGEVFTSRADGQIARYNASCAPVTSLAPIPDSAGCTPSDVFGAADLSDPLGLALDRSSSTLYVVDAGTDQVKVFVAPPPGPPQIADQWTSDVSSTNATLHATINPMRNDTSCQLQYTDDPTFQSQGYVGATAVPCDPADLGSRFADQPARVVLSGLAPGTIYHYRFVAQNSAGTDTGNDRTFTTEIPEPNLPDSRAYEQVSPPNKDLGGIKNLVGYQAAATGSAFTFSGFTSFPGSVAPGKFYYAARGATSWSAVSQIPPQSQGGNLCNNFPSVPASSADMSLSILHDGVLQQSGVRCGKDDPELVSGEPEGVNNVFLRDNATGAYQLVSLNPVTGPPADAFFEGADPAFSHLVFQESAQLTPDAPAGVQNLYEWFGGAVKLVSVAPDGTPIAAGADLASGGNGHARHAVSDDGSKIFFQTGSFFSPGNLYARVNGTDTVQLDAPQGGSGPGGGGQFQVASVDGTKVFFTDDASAGLTNDTQPGSGQNLYRYDFSTGDLTDITAAADAGVLGLAGAGDSGANIYFVASGDLASGASSGEPNLYSWADGALTFIATLSPSYPNSCVWDSSNLCSRASADGSHLAFNSDQSLTDVDTGGHTEVYLFDQGAGTLACASCPPSGAQPTGVAAIQFAVQQGGSVGILQALPRNLNADGSRLFFTADGPLLARDTNGRQDVYEYENGKLHLISTGTAPTGAIFLDASASGDDTFFVTEQRLTPFDIDGVRDIYDARVGGGFPFTPPPPPCQSADQCHPGGTVAPSTTGAGSGAFNGPGNPQINRKAKKHHKKHHHKRRHHKRTAGRRSDRASQSGSSRGSAAEPFTSNNRRAGR